MKSLRKNLLIWLLPATFAVGALASLGTYWGAWLELDDMLDDQLRYIAQHIKLNEEISPVSLQEWTSRDRSIEHKKADEVILEVWRNGKRLYSSNPQLDFSPPEKAGVQNETLNGQTWHSLIAKKGKDWLRITQVQNQRFEALAELSVHLLWPVLALLPLLAVFLWFGIGYGLRPLKQITEELRHRHIKSLQPVEPKQPVTEIQPFILALNDLLSRLDESVQAQERFIADAAHELRTPVTGLSIELQTLEKETDPQIRQTSIESIKLATTRLIHLVQQLLVMARVEADKQPVQLQPVRLLDLARSAIKVNLPAAVRRDIDLGITQQTSLSILGYEDDLCILLNNLIDNAIRYIPEGGQIDVAVYAEGDSAILSVSDDGPGIPDAEKAKVFERFYRGKHPGIQGSGLGMNIVKNIADKHQAELRLENTNDSSGLSVIVRFPKFSFLK